MKHKVLIIILFLAFLVRFYKLGDIPLSLYWDEASLGYNAFSILQSGRDEHNKKFPITNFAAFGDYKPPGYIYSLVPSIALFDLNEFSTRLPSAFFGVLTILVTYLLSKKLFKEEQIALTAAFIMAISPWHTQMSRAAFEGNMALFFSVLGFYMFIKFATDSPKYLWLSAISFIIAMYTFTGIRLFIPFILIFLTIQFRKEIFSNLKLVIFIILISSVIFWPMFRFATTTIEGRLRFDEVTIFKDLKPIEDSIKYRQRNNYAWWSNIIHNRRVFYTREYLNHYFDAFKPSFLFISGDDNPRLSIQDVGELYLINSIFLLAGIYYLFSTKNKYRYLIVGWFLISPLGPATARETPHALRMIHMMPSIQIITAFGLIYIFRIIKYKKPFYMLTSMIILISAFHYLHMYYFHYPITYAGEWQFGYKEAVQIAENEYNNVDNIIVSKKLGRPYIYFLYYLKYPPQKYFENSNIVIDQFYFIHVNSFDKFIFSDYPHEEDLKGRNLFIASQAETPNNAEIIDKINDPLGNEVFIISKNKK